MNILPCDVTQNPQLFRNKPGYIRTAAGRCMYSLSPATPISWGQGYTNSKEPHVAVMCRNFTTFLAYFDCVTAFEVP